jgi:YegS/Rv2252/BmrU family lipid kinase
MDFKPRSVRALINRRSGFRLSLEGIIRVIRDTWDCDGIQFECHETRSKEDGREKARQAITDGVEMLVVVGGDGTINSIGAELVGSDVALAVVPIGSGNGFARHFGIPLQTRRAARALKDGYRKRIDIGIAAGHPFLITCGMAWESELVRGFQQSLIRGKSSYVFAGVTRYFMYTPQKIKLTLDGDEVVELEPRILTATNLNQYGAGLKIVPDAEPDDGILNLLAIPEADLIKQVITQVPHLLEGNLWEVGGARRWTFRRLSVERERADSIQIDGELVSAERDFIIEVVPSALTIVVPSSVEHAQEDYLAADPDEALPIL